MAQQGQVKELLLLLVLLVLLLLLLLAFVLGSMPVLDCPLMQPQL
jgi:hypothetical protein